MTNASLMRTGGVARRIVAAATAAVTLLLVGATAGDVAPDQPPNSIGIRLADVPENRVDDPRASSSIIDHVAPGGRFTRSIDIISTVESTTTVEVYASNARVVDGGFLPDDSDRPGIADWVTLSDSTLALEPQSVRRVEVAVDVPTNAPNGEHVGFVWVEPPASGGDVQVANRVGIRLYVSVGFGTAPPVDFDVGALTAGRDPSGIPVVTVGLRNTGGRVLDITGELSLADGPAGLAAGPFGFDGAVTLAPDEVGSITITLDPELPDGPWSATVTAVSGLLERTAEAEIAFPSGADTTADPAESEIIGGTDEDGNDISEQLRQQRRTLLPIASLLILLALGALFLLLFWKRRDEEEDDDTPAVEAARGGADDGRGG